MPGTANGDFNPIWSPDGAQIVFNRGMGIFDLFIVNLDGSNLRQITHGGVQEWPVGWLEDGSFLYTVPGRSTSTSFTASTSPAAKAGVLEREHPIPHPMASTWLSPGWPSVSAGRSISAAWTALTAGRWPTTACGPEPLVERQWRVAAGHCLGHRLGFYHRRADQPAHLPVISCRTSKATSSTGSRKVPLLSRGWGSGGRFAPTAISTLVGSVI